MVVDGEKQLRDGWKTIVLENCVDILDNRRRPINSEEREKRISGKDESQLYPYYGATGKVGLIDDYLLDEEVVLLGEDGAPFLDFGKDKAYLVRGKSWVNNHAHVLKARDGVITNLFLMHYLNYFDYHGYVTGTTRLKLNQGQMRQFPIKVPPLSEQQRIVARIEELFTQLEAGTSALAKVQAGLRRYRASVLKSAVEGRLVESVGAHGRASSPKGGMRPSLESGRTPSARTGELPEGWRWTTTGELCDCIVPNRDKPKSFTGDIPWITLPDFTESIEIRESKSGLGLSEDEIKKYRARVIPKGSVVMSCIGRFGITAVAERDIVVNQQLHAFLVDENVLDASYLAYAIRTQVSYMEEIATATTIAYLNKENCNSVPIPLPPLEEQRRIVEEVERRLSVARQVESSVEEALMRASRLRQAILRSAFAGKLA